MSSEKSYKELYSLLARSTALKDKKIEIDQFFEDLDSEDQLKLLKYIHSTAEDVELMTYVVNKMSYDELFSSQDWLKNKFPNVDTIFEWAIYEKVDDKVLRIILDKKVKENNRILNYPPFSWMYKLYRLFVPYQFDQVRKNVLIEIDNKPSRIKEYSIPLDDLKENVSTKHARSSVLKEKNFNMWREAVAKERIQSTNNVDVLKNPQKQEDYDSGLDSSSEDFIEENNKMPIVRRSQRFDEEQGYDSGLDSDFEYFEDDIFETKSAIPMVKKGQFKRYKFFEADNNNVGWRKGCKHEFFDLKWDKDALSKKASIFRVNALNNKRGLTEDNLLNNLDKINGVMDLEVDGKMFYQVMANSPHIKLRTAALEYKHNVDKERLLRELITTPNTVDKSLGKMSAVVYSANPGVSLERNGYTLNPKNMVDLAIALRLSDSVIKKMLPEETVHDSLKAYKAKRVINMLVDKDTLTVSHNMVMDYPEYLANVKDSNNRGSIDVLLGHGKISTSTLNVVLSNMSVGTYVKKWDVISKRGIDDFAIKILKKRKIYGKVMEGRRISQLRTKIQQMLENKAEDHLVLDEFTIEHAPDLVSHLTDSKGRTALQFALRKNMEDSVIVKIVSYMSPEEIAWHYKDIDQMEKFPVIKPNLEERGILDEVREIATKQRTKSRNNRNKSKDNQFDRKALENGSVIQRKKTKKSHRKRVKKVNKILNEVKNSGFNR